MADKTGTSLIPLNENKAITAFKTPGGLEPLLTAIEVECRSIPQVLNTANGRDNIRSLAAKIASAKVRLDEIGSSLNDPLYAEIEKVNNGRKEAKARLQALQDEIRKPLTDWEAAEKTRIAAHEEKLKWFESLKVWGPEIPAPITSHMIRARMELIEQDARVWEEYENRATRIKGEVLKAMTEHLQAALDAEAEAQATAAWLAMYAEAEQENRDKDIATAAAKQAREMAEAKAAIELVWSEAHRDNADFDRVRAEENAERERWNTIYAEAESENRNFDHKAVMEKQRKQFHEDRILRIRNLAHGTGHLTSQTLKDRQDEVWILRDGAIDNGYDWQEYKDVAHRAAEEAIDILFAATTDAENREEKKRKDDLAAAQAEQTRKDNEATAEREKDLAHKQTINGDAIDAIADILQNHMDMDYEAGDNRDAAFEIVQSIARGEVPHVKITY